MILPIVTKFAKKNSVDGSSDVEVHDLISKLKIFKFTLPKGALSAMEIFEHVREVDCYQIFSLLIGSYLPFL